MPEENKKSEIHEWILELQKNHKPELILPYQFTDGHIRNIFKMLLIELNKLQCL